jgi:hypothetical protein
VCRVVRESHSVLRAVTLATPTNACLVTRALIFTKANVTKIARVLSFISIVAIASLASPMSISVSTLAGTVMLASVCVVGTIRLTFQTGSVCLALPIRTLEDSSVWLAIKLRVWNALKKPTTLIRQANA